MPLVRSRVAAPVLRPANINDLALNTTLFYAADLSYTALDIGLSSALFGVLTLLVIVALVFLIRKGFGHTPVRILLPCTLLLYGSTMLFMASLVGHVTSVDRLITQARAGLFSDAYTNVDIDAFEDEVMRHSWMMTASLGINVVVGDSIVWWRVCAVWRNRVVYCLGPLLIVLGVAFGMKGLCHVQECLEPPYQPQSLLGVGFFANASAALSLAVNVLATMLMGYKAWGHRRLLRDHFSRQKSHVLKALALLVESGTIYCILLVIVVIFQASPALLATPNVHQNVFLRMAADYTYACFTPVIAIYPVLIIVIVALNWSPIEHSLQFSDNANLAGEASRPPTRLDFNRTTMSTVVIGDTTEMLCVRNEEDSDVDAETKRGAVVV